MKRFFLKTTFILTAGLLAAACTDTISGDGSEVDTRPIAFAPGTGTRAAVNGTALPADFKVWGGYDGKPDNVFNGTTVHFPGWTYDGIQYWIAKKKYQFYGVYPATGVTASVASEGAITVEDFDCSAMGSNAVDLMTATTDTYDGDSPKTVTMQFKHELACVSVTLNGGATRVTEAKLYGFDYKGTLTRTGQSASWNNSTQCAETNTPFRADNPTGTDPFGNLLLIPQTLTGNVMLAVTYDYGDGTKSKTITAPLNSTTVAEWTAGQRYRYTATFGGGQLQLTVSVKAWDEEKADINWGEDEKE